MKIYNKYSKGPNIVAMLCVLFLLVLASCKKLVDVAPPSNSLVTTSVFNNDGTAITTQLAIYANLEYNDYNFDLFTGLSSDELTYYGTTQYQLDLYHNNLNAQNEGGLNGNWGALYSLVYQENAIIENVQTSTGMSSKVKQLMTGEALFTRAYLYFQLVNLFGDVPLITTTDYTKNSTLPRTARALVYQQMITDLKGAQGLLSSTYLDPTDNTVVTDRVRPTTWAADALLAKIYLYIEDYTNSAKQASLVIANNTTFGLVSDLTQVFQIGSQEAIWQLTPPSGAFWTVEGNGFILVVPPGGGGPGLVSALSPQLLAAFEPNDKRRTSWIGSFTQGSTTWYFPYKYRANSTATSLTEYSMVFRLAEQYLIRAEAEANNNDVSDAVNDLNIIRQRAGLPSYAGATDKASLMTAIMHEREVELFTENHRWFDLKRTGTVGAVMSVVTPQKGGNWNNYQQLYPLNATDLQLDPNLTQNPGY